jgi:hypothetical protein
MMSSEIRLAFSGSTFNVWYLMAQGDAESNVYEGGNGVTGIVTVLSSFQMPNAPKACQTLNAER